MKRDLNLIRTILLAIEANPAGRPILGFDAPGHSVEEIREHVQLLDDAGFIDANILTGGMGEPTGFLVTRMTWSGQEFLAHAKNDTIWKKVLSQAEAKGMSASMAVINGLLEAAAKRWVGLDK